MIEIRLHADTHFFTGELGKGTEHTGEKGCLGSIVHVKKDKGIQSEQLCMGQEEAACTVSPVQQGEYLALAAKVRLLCRAG